MPALPLAPWIERLARLGYVAKAVLYGTIGLLTAGAALGMGGKAGTDSHDALSTLFRAPLGRALLAITGVGLLGYGLWRILAGVLDAEGRGTGAKGLAMRASAIASGLLHLALAYTAAKLFAGAGHDPAAGSSAQSKHWAARALAQPGGVYLLWLAAGGFVGYGLYQLYKAARAKLSKQLDLGRMSREAGRWVIGVSRFGVAARGVVFGMVGVLLSRAAGGHDPRAAGGVADSLRALSRYGKWPFLVISFGLLAYAVYQLLNARYRRIRVPT